MFTARYRLELFTEKFVSSLFHVCAMVHGVNCWSLFEEGRVQPPIIYVGFVVDKVALV